jgi:hypothetical protein
MARELLDEIAALIRTDPTLTEAEVVAATLYCVTTFFAVDNPKLKVDLDAIGMGHLRNSPPVKRLVYGGSD